MGFISIAQETWHCEYTGEICRYEVSGGQKTAGNDDGNDHKAGVRILADEPTGALDSKATDSLLTLFSQINKEGQTVLYGNAQYQGGEQCKPQEREVFHRIVPRKRRGEI